MVNNQGTGYIYHQAKILKNLPWAISIHSSSANTRLSQIYMYELFMMAQGLEYTVQQTHTQMKRIVLAVIIGVASLSSLTASAQINLNINIGSQPAWGPAGYNHADYYYLPDVDSYYSIASQQYIYQLNGQWVFRKTLPPRYSGYNLYNGYKVVINSPKPYLNHAQYVNQYSKYRNYKGRQGNIRDSKDNRYAVARNNKPVPDRESHPAVRSQNRDDQGNNKDRNGRDHNRENNNNRSQRGY
ncbi:hypothetical protein [Pedobacter lusitanus]|uniref:hypothetical protein n=1 Tax=Pedobacter lusitanus TaxID=1503925 RepID=UPI000697C9F3|nr:hypothetical protein [Pedobacter lusitanus]